MTPKTILITGSTSGIGRAGAEALGSRGWRVLVHARTEARGRPVVEDLARRFPRGRFDLVTGDLTDLNQVTALAGQVGALVPSLDVLWSNAGIMTNDPNSGPQGFETQWTVNHLAPFLLTSRLLPLVQAAPAGRILQTSSFAHHWGRVPSSPDDFRLGPGRYRGLGVYGSTKLANILMVRELAKRLDGTPVRVHAFHPGYVSTEIGANGTPGQGNSGSWLGFAMVPVEKGAETGVFLAEAGLPGTRSGLYWSGCRVRRGSGKVNDPNASRLWDVTEKALEAFSPKGQGPASPPPRGR